MLLCPARDRILVEEAGLLLPPRPVRDAIKRQTSCVPNGTLDQWKGLVFYQHYVPNGTDDKETQSQKLNLTTPLPSIFVPFGTFDMAIIL